MAPGQTGEKGWFSGRQKARPSQCCGGATDVEETVFCVGG